MNTMSQSEFEANTCNWRQAQENMCGENMIGLTYIHTYLHNILFRRLQHKYKNIPNREIVRLTLYKNNFPN